MEQKTQKKHDLRWIYALIGCLLVIAAVVMILLYFMNGQTSTTEGGGTTGVRESLACEGDKTEYPFFEDDDGDKRSMKVNATFNDDKLNTISFVYQSIYNDEEKDKKEIERRKDVLYSEVTTAFQDNGLSVDALGVGFTALKNGVQMSLYSDVHGLSNLSSKFVLLDSANGSYKIDNVKKIYEGLGLKCVVNK